MPDKVTRPLSGREVAAILTGLRLLQRELDRDELYLPDGLDEVFTNADEVVPLSAEEIDGLCQAVNCGEATLHA